MSPTSDYKEEQATQRIANGRFAIGVAVRMTSGQTVDGHHHYVSCVPIIDTETKEIVALIPHDPFIPATMTGTSPELVADALNMIYSTHALDLPQS